MNPSQTSYLLQKVAPIVMKELGPRVEPIITEKVVVPLAKKVGLPIARRIGIPLARRTGTVIIKKVGFPLVNRVFKVNLSIPGNNSKPLNNILSNKPSNPVTPPQVEQVTGKAAGKPKKKLSLKNLINTQKLKKPKNKIFPIKGNPLKQLAPSLPPGQPPLKTPNPLNPSYKQPGFTPPQNNSPTPIPNTPSVQNSFEQPQEPNSFFNMNYNSSLFNRRRHNYGYNFE